ncbi:hypothetical protein G7Y89_g6814 [Cudoniella acicularis]|uniref:2EXR domain-containing protein n=1 Tax=Cudoniella acicularis TaxID=354080 RepID=A0A8H4W235_9HELO|nr:hypothetical protein G7Y89_g6814 [Cudoniella acicularis]
MNSTRRAAKAGGIKEKAAKMTSENANTSCSSSKSTETSSASTGDRGPPPKLSKSGTNALMDVSVLLQNICQLADEIKAATAEPFKQFSQARIPTRDMTASVASLQSSILAMQSLGTQLNSAGAAGSFMLLPKLPRELRLKIWKASLPGPRVVKIGYELCEYCDYFEGLCANCECYFGKVKTAQPLPTALSVCRESRVEALKKYSDKINFPTSFIRIDPRQDTLYFSRFTEHIVEVFPCETLHHSVQSLALDQRVFDDLCLGEGDDYMYPLGAFSALKELIVVLHREAIPISCGIENYTGCGELELTGPTEEVIGKWEYKELSGIGFAIEEYKSQNPKWVAPQVKVAVMGIGGEPCCLPVDRKHPTENWF